MGSLVMAVTTAAIHHFTEAAPFLTFELGVADPKDGRYIPHTVQMPLQHTKAIKAFFG